MRPFFTEAFIAGVVGLFLGIVFFVGESTLGVDKSQIISPKFEIVDPFEKVQIKLEEKRNNVRISRNVSLIQEAQAAGDFNQAYAYIVVDASTGEIIAEKSASNQLSIASITKIMTAVVASDLVELNEPFIVSENAPKVVPTNMGLVPGQEWTLEELLHGLLLTSSNDAAEVIKEGIDQKFGHGTFIRAMNAKAKFLGLKKTSFDNPQGYDGPANFSTTEDVALISLYIYKNYPKLAEIAAMDFQHFPENSTHKQADLINWNGLIGVYPGAYGLKIGNTGQALMTTVVAAQRNGNDVVVVLLGAPGVLERDLWASQLLDLGFSRKFGLEPVNLTEEQLKQKYASWRELQATFR